MRSKRPTKELLQSIYATRSMKDTARELGVVVQSVFTWLHFYNIPIRPKGVVTKYNDQRFNRKYTNRDWLFEAYSTHGKSAMDIANELKASPRTILHWLRKHGIHTRTISEANRLCENSGRFSKGSDSRGWKGGRYVDGQGYIHVTYNGEYIREHRLVMEIALGRKLTAGEVVHHINGDKKDNRIENLRLLTPNTHNSTLHLNERLDMALKEIEELKTLLQQKKV